MEGERGKGQRREGGWDLLGCYPLSPLNCLLNSTPPLMAYCSAASITPYTYPHPLSSPLLDHFPATLISLRVVEVSGPLQTLSTLHIQIQVLSGPKWKERCVHVCGVGKQGIAGQLWGLVGATSRCIETTWAAGSLKTGRVGNQPLSCCYHCSWADWGDTALIWGWKGSIWN